MARGRGGRRGRDPGRLGPARLDRGPVPDPLPGARLLARAGRRRQRRERRHPGPARPRGQQHRLPVGDGGARRRQPVAAVAALGGPDHRAQRLVRAGQLPGRPRPAAQRRRPRPRGGRGHGPLPGRGRGGGPQRPALGVLRRAAALGGGQRLAGDPSLDLVAAYGRPGEHTVAPVSDFYPPDQALEDAAVPPLQRYAVAGPGRSCGPSRPGGRCWSTATASPSRPWSGWGWPRASRRSGCSAPSPRPSWPPRWPAGPGWWSPTATGGGPGAASAPARTTRRRSGPTSRCPPPP